MSTDTNGGARSNEATTTAKSAVTKLPEDALMRNTDEGPGQEFFDRQVEASVYGSDLAVAVAFDDYEQDLLTPPEVAKHLRVGVRTLARWRSKGEGPAYSKIGNRVVYHIDDVEDFIAAQKDERPKAEADYQDSVEAIASRLRTLTAQQRAVIGEQVARLNGEEAA